MSAICRLFAVLATAALLGGCGNDLSRKKAEALLKPYAEANPSTISIQLDDVVSSSGRQGDPLERSQEVPCWRELAAKGAVSAPRLSPDPVAGRRGANYVSYGVEVVDPTNLVQVETEQVTGRVMVSARVRRASVIRSRREIVSIDGIARPSPALSVVEFSYIENATGFDSPACYSYGTRALPSGTETGRASFVLYDDGWRLESVDW